jgi:hypothetical protein
MALDRIRGGRLSRYLERDREFVQEYFKEHGFPFTDEDRAAFAQAVKKAPNADARRGAEQSLQWFDENRRGLEGHARGQIRREQAAHRRLLERISTDFDDYFGFGDEQREQDVARLTLALKRKRARMGNDGEGDCHETDFDRWEADAEQIPGTARQIASRFNCPVSDAIKHWLEHLERMNEKNRHRCEEERAQLKERGLLKDGEHGWREFHQPSGTWAHFHLPEVKTPQQISAECERIEQLWPDAKDWPAPKDWKKAQREIRRAWEKRTLYEAALELVHDNKIVSAKNLWSSLFRDEEHERKCKNYWFRQAEEEKLAKLPHIWFGQDYLKRPADYARKPFERANPFCGERGISSREFWQRYTPQDIDQAEAAARNADASDINRGSRSGDGEAVVEPEVLENMMQPGEKSQQSIDQAWAAGHRRRAANDPEIKKWVAGLSDEHQKKALEALHDPFSEGKKQRKSKFQTKLASMSEQERERFRGWLAGTA